MVYEENKKLKKRTCQSAKARRVQQWKEIVRRAMKMKLLMDINLEPAKKTKPERNQPCPCGSGKKYKKCCLHKGE